MEPWIVVSRNSFKGALMGSIRATHQFFMDPLAYLMQDGPLKLQVG